MSWNRMVVSKIYNILGLEETLIKKMQSLGILQEG